MSTHYVVDLQSGTYFNSDHAVYVADEAFTDGDGYESILDIGSDAEIIEVAEQAGSHVTKHVADSCAITSIARLMSGQEWNADTLSEIAKIVRGTGRNVDEVA